MFSKISLSRVFSVLLVVLIINGSASASPLNAALGTGFTYQGKLTDGGVPANGVYDLEFKLYDSLSAGSQRGTAVTQGDVIVNEGLFTVQLDFSDLFDGTPLYLEIGVRPGASGGAYTALAPRQQLSATPYALYARNAPWDGVKGVPAGFADGVDNGSSYQNVKVVAKSGGDFSTITAALNAITDASASNPYLVYVAPGVYNEQVTMKQFVDIEGAGELTTKITFAGSVLSTSASVLGMHDAELRFLTVENTGGAAFAFAIYNNNVSPRLTHVTASASGGTDNRGIYNYNSSSPTMTDVTASAAGGTNSFGVVNTISSSPTMKDVTASALGGTNNYGVYNYSSSSPTMTDVTANALVGTNNYGIYNETSSSPTMMEVTATASDGVANYGVYNIEDSAPKMTDVTVTVWGGSSVNYGVYNITDYDVSNSPAFSPTMTNVTVSASGGPGSTNYGVYNHDSMVTINSSIISASGGVNSYGIYSYGNPGWNYPAYVNHSQITATTNTIYATQNYTVTYVGASLLRGGTTTPHVGSTVNCVGVYTDGYYTFYTGTCP